MAGEPQTNGEVRRGPEDDLRLSDIPDGISWVFTKSNPARQPDGSLVRFVRVTFTERIGEMVNVFRFVVDETNFNRMLKTGHEVAGGLSIATTLDDVGGTQ